ncbi:putative ORFan [Tupanvirus deep ocean]|uniref:ORFan n=2 Tax=Tupanvirus TaxID=2094720 RepID=A0AC62A9S7_9VIRU|nr:putative ORFan [Tupanvirus deep ocean]QKU34393.1 putative ORFan [Tupanvirus deep ocean]
MFIVSCLTSISSYVYGVFDNDTTFNEKLLEFNKLYYNDFTIEEIEKKQIMLFNVKFELHGKSLMVVENADDTDVLMIVFLGKFIEFGDEDTYSILNLVKNELVHANDNMDTSDFDNVFYAMFGSLPNDDNELIVVD